MTSGPAAPEGAVYGVWPKRKWLWGPEEPRFPKILLTSLPAVVHFGQSDGGLS